MKKIKTYLKNILTFIRYPILTCKLWIRGGGSIYIGKGLTINTSKDLFVENNFYMGKDCRILLVYAYHGRKYKPQINIGENVMLGNRCSILSAAPITIESDVLIASDVLISSENHSFDPEKSVSYAKQVLQAKPIIIGSGTWIGEKAIILPGVIIGKKCVVAAGSIVTKSVPDYCVIAGNPAKIIKAYNFTTHKWERDYIL